MARLLKSVETFAQFDNPLFRGLSFVGYGATIILGGAYLTQGKATPSARKKSGKKNTRKTTMDGLEFEVAHDGTFGTGRPGGGQGFLRNRGARNALTESGMDMYWASLSKDERASLLHEFGIKMGRIPSSWSSLSAKKRRWIWGMIKARQDRELGELERGNIHRDQQHQMFGQFFRGARNAFNHGMEREIMAILNNRKRTSINSLESRVKKRWESKRTSKFSPKMFIDTLDLLIEDGQIYQPAFGDIAHINSTDAKKNANNNDVAQTILRQLGGNKFIAMTGAHTLLSSKNSLSLKFKGSTKANHLKVTLRGDDTYDMVFNKLGRAPNFNVTKVKEYNGVYAGMLQELFTGVTGLETSLGTMRARKKGSRKRWVLYITHPHTYDMIELGPVQKSKTEVKKKLESHFGRPVDVVHIDRDPNTSKSIGSKWANILFTGAGSGSGFLNWE